MPGENEGQQVDKWADFKNPYLEDQQPKEMQAKNTKEETKKLPTT
jgi:hypothetical protein